MSDSPADPIATFVDLFLLIGVNCFVLISGYFGIRFKFKSLYKLFIQCAVYGLAFYIFHLLYKGNNVGRSILYNGLFVFSSPPGWWFIRVYVYLYFLSPILNKVIENASKKEMHIYLCLLAILNIYFGWLHQGEINPDGYNISNFAFLYFIGRYLNLHFDVHRFKTRHYFAAYLAVSAILGAIAICNSFYFTNNYAILAVHSYNNPLLIISSVCFFLVFVSFGPSINKGSDIIRYLSSSALAIYLLTENTFFNDNLYGFVKDVCIRLSGPDMSLKSWGILIILTLAIMGICLIIDKIRLLIMHPLDKRIYKIADQLDKKVYCIRNRVEAQTETIESTKR